MLYSLCILFQVELEIFKINLKIVFCVKYFYFECTQKLKIAWSTEEFEMN